MPACPNCGYQQDEQCVITDEGAAFACEAPPEDCRVSTFLAGDEVGPSGGVQ